MASSVVFNETTLHWYAKLLRAFQLSIEESESKDVAVDGESEKDKNNNGKCAVGDIIRTSWIASSLSSSSTSTTTTTTTTTPSSSFKNDVILLGKRRAVPTHKGRPLSLFKRVKRALSSSHSSSNGGSGGDGTAYLVVDKPKIRLVPHLNDVLSSAAMEIPTCSCTTANANANGGPSPYCEYMARYKAGAIASDALFVGGRGDATTTLSHPSYDLFFACKDPTFTQVPVTRLQLVATCPETAHLFFTGNLMCKPLLLVAWITDGCMHARWHYDDKSADLWKMRRT
ncbi:MAG: hypothetical protein WC763_05400 [Candidatus Paceibacterota bacterium]|jgi:hypothetical protein